MSHFTRIFQVIKLYVDDKSPHLGGFCIVASRLARKNLKKIFFNIHFTLPYKILYKILFKFQTNLEKYDLFNLKTSNVKCLSQAST